MIDHQTLGRYFGYPECCVEWFFTADIDKVLRHCSDRVGSTGLLEQVKATAGDDNT